MTSDEVTRPLAVGEDGLNIYAEDTCVATIYPDLNEDGRGWKQASILEANARAHLLAAAPDLLEQLKHARALLLDAYSVFGEDRLKGIDAAIAKAEGRA